MADKSVLQRRLLEKKQQQENGTNDLQFIPLRPQEGMNAVPPQLQSPPPQQQKNNYRFGKIKRLQSMPAPDHPLTPEENPMNAFEMNVYKQEEKAEREHERVQLIKKRISKFVQVLLIIACIYMCFLIYGMSNTEYVYDMYGRVVPEELTVDVIKDREQFRMVKSQYLQVRTLYEETLVLDYRLGTGLEDPLLIAPEYERVLEKVSQLAIQISAQPTPARYVQLMGMMQSWVKNDIALYCQNISMAIARNSQQHASRALQHRNDMYNKFLTITQNIVTLGSQISGVDIQPILEWSPEIYVRQFVSGGTK